jgi:DNA-binding GntR family transcriptional regulator
MKKQTSEKNQSEIAYTFLRQKLLNRELTPGSRVRYGPLGTEIGMSATPVREAIGRLASEGLIDLVPQLGAVVKRPTRSDATEVFEMREAIEPFAAAKASQLISVGQLKTLQATLDTMKKLKTRATSGKASGHDVATPFDQADLRFHLTILAAVDNRRMLKAVGDFHLLTEIIGADRHSYSVDVLQMTISDHAEILAAMKKRDAESVRQAMVTHIRNSRQLTLSLLTGDDSRSAFLAE